MISSERDRDGVKERKKERPIEKMGVFCVVWDFRVWGLVCFLGCGAKVFVRYLYCVECVISV
jgi:hypothetical protein